MRKRRDEGVVRNNISSKIYDGKFGYQSNFIVFWENEMKRFIEGVSRTANFWEQAVNNRFEAITRNPSGGFRVTHSVFGIYPIGRVPPQRAKNSVS
jgi:hypothetical protein